MSSEDRFFESVIRKALPHHFDVQFCMTDTYQTIEPSNEGISNVYIRPLHHLVSLPLQTRRRLYGPLFKNQRALSTIVSPMRSVLKEAVKIVTSKYGEDLALRWRDETYQRATSLFISEGIRGLFFNQNGIVQLKENGESSRYQYEEVLQFKFPQGWHTIATRTVTPGLKPMAFSIDKEDLWEATPKNEDLFEAVKSLYLVNIDSPKDGLVEIFLWHDQPLENYTSSFIKSAIKDAESTFSVTSRNRSICVLLLTASDLPGLKGLNGLEKLSLQRMDGIARVMFSPGKQEVDVQTNRNISNMDEIAGTQFEEKVFSRLEKIGLDVTSLFDDEPTFLFHRDTIDSNDASFLSISFQCWSGIWMNSLEIDGEYVIS